MTDLFFSIIIPAYNNLELFTAALHSVLRQENAKFEIIVSDDSTTNVIGNYCKQFHPSVRYYLHKQMNNAISNWNFGLSRARGNCLILLHHDEIFASEFHLMTLKRIFMEGQADVIISPIKVHNGKIDRTMKIPHSFSSFIYNYCPCFLYIVNIIGPTACVAIKVVNEMPEFDERLKWFVDVDWYYNLLKGKRVGLNRESVIASNNNHEDKITNMLNVKLQAEKDYNVLKNKYPLFSMPHFFIWAGKWLKKLKPIVSKYLNFIWR